MCSIERDRIVPNLPPRLAIHRVHDTNGPRPNDDEFNCIRVTNVPETIDGCDDFSGID